VDPAKAAYWETALGNACRELANAGDGERHATLRGVAFGIGRLVGGGLGSAEEARAAILQAIEGWPQHAKTAKTLDDALRAGQERPRVLDDSERPHARAAGGPKTRPPAEEVRELWDRSIRLTDCPADCQRDPCPAKRLLGRGMHPKDVGHLDVARCIAPPPWPSWWRPSWSAYSLIAPAFEPNGQLASIHGRAAADVGDDPKTRWPAGHTAGGLLFADVAGRAVLKGTPMLLLHGVLIVEGMTDTIAASIWAARRVCRRGERVAVLGITSGATAALASVDFRGRPVYVATDPDGAGERYAEEIAKSLPAGVRLKRVRMMQCR